MIYIADCEEGTASIGNLVASGDVVPVTCSKFAHVEDAFWRVKRGEVAGVDMFGWDTMTTMATTTRHDIIVDPEELGGASLWLHKGKLTAAQRDWGNMSDLMNRLARMIRSLPIPTVFVCHEGEREDPQTGINKFGPDLNQAILRDVIAFSDAMVRLSIAPESFKAPDGKEYPAGTRVLRLASNGNAMAKVRVPEDVVVPPIIADPDFTKLVAALGFVPKKLTIYGASGVGKTRFLGSYVSYLKSLNIKSTEKKRANAAA